MRYHSIKDPIRIYNEILGGKWRLLILFQLFTKTQRFKDLQSNIKGITPRMLTKELRILEKYNIVEKEVYREVPPRVEYSLTDDGIKLYPLIDDIIKFGEDFAYLLNSDYVKEPRHLEEEIVDEITKTEIVKEEEPSSEKNQYFIVEKIEEPVYKPIHQPIPKVKKAKVEKPKPTEEPKVVQLELF